MAESGFASKSRAHALDCWGRKGLWCGCFRPPEGLCRDPGVSRTHSASSFSAWRGPSACRPVAWCPGRQGHLGKAVEPRAIWPRTLWPGPVVPTPSCPLPSPCTAPLPSSPCRCPSSPCSGPLMENTQMLIDSDAWRTNLWSELLARDPLCATPCPASSWTHDQTSPSTHCVPGSRLEIKT